MAFKITNIFFNIAVEILQFEGLIFIDHSFHRNCLVMILVKIRKLPLLLSPTGFLLLRNFLFNHIGRVDNNEVVHRPTENVINPHVRVN